MGLCDDEREQRLALATSYEEWLAAARALAANSDLDARSIAERAMAIAADICIYTNSNVTVETL